MDTDLLQKIFKEHRELLSLPQTLVEVLRVIRDDKSSADELARVLMRDPALTARVLRIVNSSFYGAQREITTVSKAVVMLGMRQVTALALSTSIYNLASSWETKIDRVKFWRHSLEVAIAARMIAERIQYPHIEEAFVAGLLHDIGLLIIEKSFPEEFCQIIIRGKKGDNTVELEEELWGTNHARVGQFLLEQWNIPRSICDAVGHHHNQYPAECNNSELIYSQIIALANLLSSFRVIREPHGEQDFEIENRLILCDNLGLSADNLKEIQVQLLPRTVEEARYLEIDIGSFDDILLDANRLLAEQYTTVEGLLSENRRMQQQIIRTQMKEASLEALKTITATFNHYINNATATILGRAQLVEMAIAKKEMTDRDGSLARAMEAIINGVNTISLVMKELKDLSSFETTVFHEEHYIIDIENKVKKQLEELQKTTAPD